MKKIIVMLSLLLTSGCSMPVNIPLASIKNTLPIGSVLQLTQTIVIPADRSYMYIANGELKKLKNYNTVNIYYPYCTIHLHNDSEKSRQIMPGHFEVTKIEEWEREYGSLFNKNKTFVQRSGGRFIKTSMSDGGGPSIVMHATIISLRSINQPEVKELVCGHWNDPSELEALTLNEMKSALGELIIIKKPKEI